MMLCSCVVLLGSRLVFKCFVWYLLISYLPTSLVYAIWVFGRVDWFSDEFFGYVHVCWVAFDPAWSWLRSILPSILVFAIWVARIAIHCVLGWFGLELIGCVYVQCVCVHFLFALFFSVLAPFVFDLVASLKLPQEFGSPDLVPIWVSWHCVTMMCCWDFVIWLGC